ncbi:Ger(x)C family spore germination protein [Neobacillus mesonae]|nr:Ger(x)C family spore germination protein [Neobacillus mesonae]
MRKLFLIGLCTSLFFISGCWDTKEVQSLNFITTLGIDYKDDQYIAYAQLVDFANIATQEGPSQRNEGKVWVGEGKGRTLSLAFNDLYRTSQQRSLWTHLKAIVLSENILNDKLEDTFNSLLHFGELRYTPWIYGTSEDLVSVLSSTTILNQSIQSIESFEPLSLYRQNSEYEPLRLHVLTDGFREPATTVFIPSLSNINDTWTEGGSEKPPMLHFNGLYVISRKKNRGRVSGLEADGARYVNYRKMQQYPLDLNPEEIEAPVLMIKNPNSVIKVHSSNSSNVKFNISVEVTGSILEDQMLDPDNLIKSKAEQRLEQKIRYTFDKAKEKNIDIYGLEEHLYRRQNELWRKIAKGREHPVTQFELNQVKVNVHILNSNTYK